MKAIVGILSVTFVIADARAETENFDHIQVGTLPRGWIAGATGGGTPTWAVEVDDTAPTRPKVLKQSGAAPFPWCVKRTVSIRHGLVEVKFKPIAGRADQAGGVVWRWQDGDNYYVARANALENNVALYYVERGRRHTITYADAPVAPNRWHRLRVHFLGKRIAVSLNGKRYIVVDDAHITSAGAVGVWTKADSDTAFDGFRYAGRTAE
jgi:hypothetical protein